jgi:hypothetical protein
MYVVQGISSSVSCSAIRPERGFYIEWYSRLPVLYAPFVTGVELLRSIQLKYYMDIYNMNKLIYITNNRRDEKYVQC